MGKPKVNYKEIRIIKIYLIELLKGIGVNRKLVLMHNPIAKKRLDVLANRGILIIRYKYNKASIEDAFGTYWLIESRRDDIKRLISEK